MFWTKWLQAVFNLCKLPSYGTDGVFKAECNYCKKQLSGITKVTTGLWKHLRRAHPSVLKESSSKEPQNQQTIALITTSKYNSLLYKLEPMMLYYYLCKEIYTKDDIQVSLKLHPPSLGIISGSSALL